MTEPRKSWFPPNSIPNGAQQAYDAMTPADRERYLAKAIERLDAVLDTPKPVAPVNVHGAAAAWLDVLEGANGEAKKHLLMHMLSPRGHSGTQPWVWVCDFANGRFKP